MNPDAEAADGAALAAGAAGDQAGGVVAAWAGFCSAVVPMPQARGLFRRDYSGTTLRAHLRD
jgi:hypothetical protein